MGAKIKFKDRIINDPTRVLTLANFISLFRAFLAYVGFDEFIFQIGSRWQSYLLKYYRYDDEKRKAYQCKKS